MALRPCIALYVPTCKVERKSHDSNKNKHFKTKLEQRAKAKSHSLSPGIYGDWYVLRHRLWDLCPPRQGSVIS